MATAAPKIANRSMSAPSQAPQVYSSIGKRQPTRCVPARRAERRQSGRSCGRKRQWLGDSIEVVRAEDRLVKRTARVSVERQVVVELPDVARHHLLHPLVN